VSPSHYAKAPFCGCHRFAPLRGFQNRPYAKWPAPARLQARQSPPYARCRVLPGRSLAGLPLGARRLVNQRLRRVGLSCAHRASNGGVPPARPSRAASRLRQARGGPVRPPEGGSLPIARLVFLKLRARARPVPAGAVARAAHRHAWRAGVRGRRGRAYRAAPPVVRHRCRLLRAARPCSARACWRSCPSCTPARLARQRLGGGRWGRAYRAAPPQARALSLSCSVFLFRFGCEKVPALLIAIFGSVIYS
jgi:hypothetical protein